MRKVKQIVKQSSNSRKTSELQSPVLRLNGSVPGGIRTHDPLLRRQPLCPTELQGLAVYHVNVACGKEKVKLV